MLETLGNGFRSGLFDNIGKSVRKCQFYSLQEPLIVLKYTNQVENISGHDSGDMAECLSN